MSTGRKKKIPFTDTTKAAMAKPTAIKTEETNTELDKALQDVASLPAETVNGLQIMTTHEQRLSEFMHAFIDIFELNVPEAYTMDDVLPALVAIRKDLDRLFLHHLKEREARLWGKAANEQQQHWTREAYDVMQDVMNHCALKTSQEDIIRNLLASSSGRMAVNSEIAVTVHESGWGAHQEDCPKQRGGFTCNCLPPFPMGEQRHARSSH